jgi:colanic acid/amylovoran biosynthesis glycosyltransferase
VDRTGDRDGLPNVVLEAMACGRPVIASDVGAVESAVVHGVTGLLTQPGNAESLATVIDLLGEQYSRLQQFGIRARERVQHHYDLRICTGRFHDLLRSAYAC